MHVELDVELPHELAVGAGTAVFVAGWCFEPTSDIRALRFVVDGERQPVMAFGMPRLDPFRALHPHLDPDAAGELPTDPGSAEDPELRSYRSGFWGLVRVRPRAGRTRLELGLEAELATGRTAAASLPAIPITPPPTSAPGQPALHQPAASQTPSEQRPLVAICMATYNPPADLLTRQLDSIRDQTHHNWICLISDDCSDPTAFDTLAQAVGTDPRFVVSRSARRLGFYRNFERALTLVADHAPDADYVALADQDDRWDPDKLQTLVAAIADAQLVYSDCRVVDRDGTLIHDTYWRSRANNHDDMLSLLVANSVSGAATLIRRDLLADALPFPPDQFAHYHDHWLALVALALGEIRFVDRPLYDYVQHGRAALGHAAATSMPSLRSRLRHQDPRERVRMWRLHYFVDACRLLQCAATLQLRCGDRLTPGSRRALTAFMDAEHSLPALMRLGLRGARELAARRPQTLGAEWMLFRAFSWRRLVAATARPRPQRRLRLDALPPPDLAPRPASPGGPASAPAVLPPPAHAIAAKIAPLALAPSPTAPVRINLLVPTIDLTHFFGGYIAKFNLAHRLAECGFRVRIVTVDPTPPLPRSWRRQVEAYSGLQGALDRVEVAFGREQGPLETHPDDGYIATTWWTAHIAHRALGGGQRPFLYLIQEYEPFTFPMGTYAALAAASYDLPHVALFSTELLRDYFRGHRLGVFAQDRDSTWFENALTPVTPPSPAAISGRRPRRLLFYARPEPHAARNLYELGLLALAAAPLPADWELNGVGSVGAEQAIALGGGRVLRLRPRTSESAYARMLAVHDVGLALMYTPHPSLVPIEMAAAGMLTVTNTFENKTADALRAISLNLIAAAPAVDAVASALAMAMAGADDAERRITGSAVNWSRQWAHSFDDALLRRLAEWLGWRSV